MAAAAIICHGNERETRNFFFWEGPTPPDFFFLFFFFICNADVNLWISIFDVRTKSTHGSTPLLCWMRNRGSRSWFAPFRLPITISTPVSIQGWKKEVTSHSFYILIVKTSIIISNISWKTVLIFNLYKTKLGLSFTIVKPKSWNDGICKHSELILDIMMKKVKNWQVVYFHSLLFNPMMTTRRERYFFQR